MYKMPQKQGACEMRRNTRSWVGRCISGPWAESCGPAGRLSSARRPLKGSGDQGTGRLARERHPGRNITPAPTGGFSGVGSPAPVLRVNHG